LIDISELKHGVGSIIPEKLLEDGCWKRAVFYGLDTESLFWNRASLVSIPKTYAKNASMALLYLLQKEAHILYLWKKEWGDTPPSIEQFIDSVIGWGRFSNTQGRSVPADDFRETFTSTLEGLTGEGSFDSVKMRSPLLTRKCLEKKTWRRQFALMIHGKNRTTWSRPQQTGYCITG
jgi:hypothetical protein